MNKGDLAEVKNILRYELLNEIKTESVKKMIYFKNQKTNFISYRFQKDIKEELVYITKTQTYSGSKFKNLFRILSHLYSSRTT